MNKPIGVATHLAETLTRSLPEHLQSELPTIEALEAEVATISYPEGENVKQ